MNKVVADVTAWSLKICTSGVGPQRGFYNEAFPEKSYRHGLSGKILAGGWKPLDRNKIILGKIPAMVFHPLIPLSLF